MEKIYKELIINKVEYMDVSFLPIEEILKIFINVKKVKFISEMSNPEQIRGIRDTYFFVCINNKLATRRFKELLSLDYIKELNIKSNFNNLRLDLF